MNLRRSFPLLLIAAAITSAAHAADVEFKSGKLIFASTDKGDRIVDFSYAGYRAGESPIPTVAAKVAVGAPTKDNTIAIQAALDAAAQMPLDANGFRAAVIIPAGTYPLSGSLTIRASGVVLRGSGAGEGGTTLLATGNDRRTVIRIVGEPAPAGDSTTISDAYVPLNSTVITVDRVSDLRAGDMIQLTHPSTKEWIAAIGMNDFGGDRHGPSWRPGSRDIHWTRQITQVEGNTLTLDVPLTLALDAQYGKSIVAKLRTDKWIRNAGVENLRIDSEFDEKNPKDEEHAWFGVGIEHARDVWVRRLTCQHLPGSAVAVWESASRVTIEDCKNLRPVGEIGGLRRNAFFTNGQQVLMQRLYSEQGLHDFAVGLTAAGPNAFVQCEAVDSLGESGAIDSAACGTLFDRVRIDGQALSLRNRGYEGQGVGWASFNGVLWNSSGSVVRNEKPPLGQNWCFGVHGEYDGNGSWTGSDDDVSPDSLFYTQLAERIGKDAAARAQLNLPPVQGSRAPTLESAADAIAVSMKPRVTMSEWIDRSIQQNPIPIELEHLSATPPRFDESHNEPLKSCTIQNGWLTIEGRIAIGKSMSVPWWRGGLREDDRAKAEPALTRFVPGRIGLGFTDNIQTLGQSLLDGGYTSLFQHPPLWYERRRDDHSRVQRMDGEVVGPFYEAPWARSGEGIASDGLSKWDVTKVNPWYFARLRQFADVGAEKGLVLFNGLYMQHSVLEAGAHYADAPWRPANNINNVGIPEPVFFAGDKLIYVAEQFYDVSNADRAALHRTYMRNVLNELADKPNVILFLSDEYTGPLAFTQFWLDVVSEWKKETGKDVKIALYATKDVTDNILADAKRAAVVSILYNRFNNEGDAGWWYQPDGTLYAPVGGKNLSPRQWSRLLKPKNSGFEQVMKAVREYRLKYPGKPFVYDGPAEFAWAALLGGGSMPALPKTTDPTLLAAIAKMKPVDNGLADGEGNALMLAGGKAIREVKGTTVRSIDMSTGQVGPSVATSKLLWITTKSD